jgi:hypothetical protein
MANTNFGTLRRSEIHSRSYSGETAQSDGSLTSFEDGFDFPPTAHPARELLTFSAFALGVVGLMVWGVLKLF